MDDMSLCNLLEPKLHEKFKLDRRNWPGNNGRNLQAVHDDFPNDQQSPLQIRSNFITVPLQFSTTALLYANATINDGFDIPDDMQATASAALGRYRWKARLWTVVTWIGVAGTLLLSSGGMILWILFQDPTEVNSTAFPFVDWVSHADSGCSFSDPRVTLANQMHAEELAEKNTCGVIECFGKKRGYLIRVRCGAHENCNTTHVVFVVEKEEV